MIESVIKPRRIHATILFIDLCNSSGLAEHVDPEILAIVKNALLNHAEEVVTQFQGVVNQFYGDAVLAAFGYPNPHEDDTRHAVEAALEIHARINALNLRKKLSLPIDIRLHSGIDAGLLVVEEGDYVQGRYVLSGDAPNTAQRLSKVAGCNELLVSSTALQGVEAFFNTEPLPQLQLQGKKATHAFKVSSRTNISTRYQAHVQRGLTPFLARESELQHLTQDLSEIFQGKIKLSCVLGDAGLGKTRLVEQFLNLKDLSNCQIFRIYCQSHFSGVPIQPFVQLLQQLELNNSQLLNDMPMAIGSLARSDQKNVLQPPSADFVSAIITLLEALFSHSPLVIFIDDWHFADDTSKKIVNDIFSKHYRCPIHIVICARNIEFDDPAYEGTVQTLNPLCFDDAEKIINALFTHHLELNLTENLYERTGGNPLFIEELCHSKLANINFDYCVEDDEVVPITFHGLIGERLNNLTEDAVKLAGIAAVIGNVIPLWLFKKVVSEPVSHLSLQHLAKQDLIFLNDSKDTLIFKHGITRDVVYESVTLKERKKIHLRTAEYLLSLEQGVIHDDMYEALAHHFECAQEYSKAIYYAERAGNKALANSSLDIARRQYQRVLLLLERKMLNKETIQHWLAVSEQWALTCTYSPASEQLDILYRAINYAQQIKDRKSVAHSQYWLGWISYALGDYQTSITHLKKALLYAECEQDSKFATQLQATLGQSQAAACNYPQALKLLGQALLTKRRHPSKNNPAVGLAYALACKAMVLADQGGFRAARELMEESLLVIAKQHQAIEGSILALYSSVLLWQGNWQEAYHRAQQAQQLAEQFCEPYVFAMSNSLQTYALWKQHSDQTVISRLQQASDWLETKGICLYASFNYSWIADSAADAGLYQLAKDYAYKALKRAKKNLDCVGEAMAYRALGKVAAISKDTSLLDARGYFEKALLAAQKRQSRHDTAVSQLYLASDDFSNGLAHQALQNLNAAKLAFNDMDMHWHKQQAQTLETQYQHELSSDTPPA